MPLTSERPVETETRSGSDWLPALSAIQTLNSCDVAIIQQAVAGSSEELSELNEALSNVQQKLNRAEEERAALDERLNAIFKSAALIRHALDHNAEFAGVHSINAEAAIENVKPLQRLAR